MIRIPTTLVLGAGSSSPYKYPTGTELLNELISNTLNTPALELLVKLGISNDEVRNFVDSLMRSASSSIDVYLEHRPEHTNLGKILITRILINREVEDNLLRQNWYQYMFNFLNSSIDDFPQNRLSIITFNYDRSLEHFLYIALKHKYNISDTKVLELLKAIPIIHVHGKISPLPWENLTGSRPYHDKADIETVSASSTGIKIIHEQDSDQNELFKKANETLLNSEKIYFLGFGYHQISLERLGLSRIDNNGRDINGTRFHLTGRQVDRIVRNNLNIRNLHNVGGHLDVLGFLKEHVDFE